MREGKQVRPYRRGSGNRPRRFSKVVGEELSKWDRTSEDIPKNLHFRSITEQEGEEIYILWRDEEGRYYRGTYALVTVVDDSGDHVRLDPDDLELNRDNFDPLLHMIYKDEFTQPVQSDFTILGRDREGNDYDLRYRFYYLERVPDGAKLSR